VPALRKRAEEALREPEAKYKTLFASAAEGILVADLKTKQFRYANPALCRMFGYTEEALMRLRVADIHPKESLDHVLAEFEAQARGEKTLAPDLPCLRKDGTLFYANVSAALTVLDGHKCNVGFFTDVTELKQAQEALLESNERFRLAIMATEDGLWEWDIQTNKEFFSPRWCEIIGYSFDDPELPHTFKSWTSRIHPDDYDRVMDALNNHLENGTKYDVDYLHRHKSGEYRWQNSRGQAVFHESGKPTKMVGCISDITLRKQAEEALKRANEDLVQMSRVKADFTSMVSHELRTPLASIKEAIAIVLDGIDGPVNDEQRETLGYARESVDRLAKLINDVLDFSKMETGKVEMSFEESDMGELAERVYRSMKLTADKEGVDLQLSIPDHGVYANCDAEKFEQVLVNLLGNAINFTKRGGRVDLRLRALDNRVAFEVEDTGIGIEEKDMGKIFEAFGQARRAGARKPGGTGLGLSISKQIVDAHGGEIAVESIPGKGTRFIVSIPYGVRGRA
jgi:PAS domain S-box-containing protein